MNRGTRITVTVLGTIFGLSGMNHGFFEALQGNTPTDGLFINAIGTAQRMWIHGDEPAFTLIPNFLITGIAAMLVGLSLIVWSIGFVQRRNGPAILLGLFVLLLLVGGGIAQVLFFPWICLVSTQINSPLTWWKVRIKGRLRRGLVRLWLGSLLLCAALMLFVFVIGVTGFVPGLNNAETVLTVMLGCLVVEVVLFPLTFVAGFAKDAGTAANEEINQVHIT